MMDIAGKMQTFGLHHFCHAMFKQFSSAGHKVRMFDDSTTQIQANEVVGET